MKYALTIAAVFLTIAPAPAFAGSDSHALLPSPIGRVSTVVNREVSALALVQLRANSYWTSSGVAHLIRRHV